MHRRHDARWAHDGFADGSDEHATTTAAHARWRSNGPGLPAPNDEGTDDKRAGTRNGRTKDAAVSSRDDDARWVSRYARTVAKGFGNFSTFVRKEHICI